MAALPKTILVPSGEKTGVEKLAALPSTPCALRETRVTAPVVRSLMKMSSRRLTSSAVKAVVLVNATLVPSGEKLAAAPKEAPCAPAALTETSVTAPVVRSLMRMSPVLAGSAGVRFFAAL